MAKKSCALIGPGQGPKVHVGREFNVVVRGLMAGESLVVRQYFEDGEVACSTIHADGSHPFGEALFIEAQYDGGNRRMIANVLMEN